MSTGITSFVLDQLTEGELEPIEISLEAAAAICAEVDRELFGPDLEAVVEEILALSEVLELEQASPGVARVLVEIVDRKHVIDELVARRPAATFERGRDKLSGFLALVGSETDLRQPDPFRPEDGVYRFGIARRV